jgi:hypothetical protein
MASEKPPQPDQLERAARQAFEVLACYDAAGKGGMTFAKWQDLRLAALHDLREALAGRER